MTFLYKEDALIVYILHKQRSTTARIVRAEDTSTHILNKTYINIYNGWYVPKSLINSSYLYPICKKVLLTLKIVKLTKHDYSFVMQFALSRMSMKLRDLLFTQIFVHICSFICNFILK